MVEQEIDKSECDDNAQIMRMPSDNDLAKLYEIGQSFLGIKKAAEIR